MKLPPPRLAAIDEYGDIAAQWPRITESEDTPEAVAEVGARLSWWLGETPNGRGRLAVIEAEGRYLGVAGWCPKVLVADGDEISVAEIGATMTDPEARGKGAFSALVEFLVSLASEQGIRAIYGTPNVASGSPYVGKLSFKNVWPWSRWIRPAGAVTGLPFVGLGGMRAALRGRPGGKKQSPPPQVTKLSDWAEAESCSPSGWDGGRPRIRKDATYLAWRYPSDRYDAYALGDEAGRVLGWAVLGSTVRLGRSAVSIADLRLAEEGRAHGPAFVRSLARLARARDARPQLAFSMTAPSGIAAESLAAAGFISRPSPWPLIVRGLDGAEIEDVFERLDFVAGDSDTV